MGLIALLRERVGLSSSGKPVIEETRTTCYSASELESIGQEQRFNSMLADEAGRRRGITVDRRIAAANLR